MASKKNLIIGISALTVLILGFQNCSPARFTDTKDSIEKASSIPDAEIQPDEEVIVPPVDDVDPRQTESGEVKCQSSIVQAAIVYDSIADSQSAAKSFSGSAVSSEIKEEYISYVGSTAIKNLSITARQVDQVKSLAAQSLSINAQKIGFVGNLSSHKINLVGYSVQDPAQLAGHLCISANRIPSIGHMAGSITVFGRALENTKASIDSIAHVAGYLSLYDVDLATLERLATKAKFDNVHLQTLKSGAGELILVNSTIDQVDAFTGTIRLRGTSKIGNISAQTSVRVIQE